MPNSDDRDERRPSLAARARSAPLPQSLSIWTGYLLNRVAQQTRDFFEALVEPLGLKARHYSVLSLINETPGLSQIEMGERLGIDRNSMVQLLNDLEEKAFVERRRDVKDRRAHCVTLTVTGRDVLAQATEMVRLTNEEVLSPLTPAEREILRGLLSRLL